MGAGEEALGSSPIAMDRPLRSWLVLQTVMALTFAVARAEQGQVAGSSVRGAIAWPVERSSLPRNFHRGGG